MKKIIGDEVFLQKYDVDFIFHELKSVPIFVVDALFGGDGYFYMNGGGDSVEFATPLRDEAAKWVIEQDWIVNIDDYRRMSAKEVVIVFKEEEKLFKQKADEFGAHDKRWQKLHFAAESEKFAKMTHRLKSLDLMIKFLDKEVKFKIPGEKKRRFFQ